MGLRWTTIGLIGAVLLAACAQPDPTPTPTAAPAPAAPGAGPELIALMGCSGCHTIDSVPGARGQIGPDLSHIGGRADAAYIRESIIDPNAVIATGCPTFDCRPGVMPPTLGAAMTSEELDALVDYLASLR